MHHQPQSAPIQRRWTPSEDARLKHLRIIEKRTWRQVASALGRTVPAVQGHYHQLKTTEGASFEDWNASMDEYIIMRRGLGMMSKDIALEMDVSAEAVQGRWYELQQQKKVPEDVLAIWKKKGEVKWSEKEDEAIIQLWIAGKSEDEIVRCALFESKFMCDVKERYKKLFREKGPVYRRLMGMESQPLPHALEKALGKKKYAWM